MSSRTAARMAALFLWGLSITGSWVHLAHARSYEELFAEQSPQGLRGAAIDLGDSWAVARLLAEFGETDRSLAHLLSSDAAASISGSGLRLHARLLVEARSYARAESLLAHIPESQNPRDHYLICLQRARINVLGGRYDGAISIDGLIGASGPAEFEPYRDMVAVEALTRGGRAAEAYERGKRRLTRGVPPSLSPAFENRFLDACLEAGRDQDALAMIEDLKSRRSQRSLYAPVIAREVDVRFLFGDSTGAIQASIEFVRANGPVEGSEVVAGVLGRIDPGELENAVLLDFADVCVRSGRSSEAERLVDALDEGSLRDAERERARLMRSELLYAQRRYDSARREAAAAFSDPALERNAKILRARVLRAAGERKRAAGAYEAFAVAYPLDPKAPEALYVAAELYDETGNESKATNLLTRTVDAYADHKYSRLAALRLALDHSERRQFTAAARTLERALGREGRRDEALLFYLADMHGKLGNEAAKDSLTAELVVLDPASFYLDPSVPPDDKVLGGGRVVSGDPDDERGTLKFLKAVHEKRDAARERVAQRLGGWSAEAVPDSIGDRFARGVAFMEMGFHDWAEAELAAVELDGGTPARALLELGALFDDFAMPWRSVRAYQRAYYALDGPSRRELDGEFRALMYPIPFPFTVSMNCALRGFPRHLAYAVVREESRFQRTAVSGAGAQGLMQIMPRTGEEIAGRLGLSGAPENDLLLPEVNLAVGISYASSLLERSKGDPLMMLAAYNAGFSNAKRWFGGRASKRPAFETVDRIEFAETREYVKRVVESARVYHALYFSSGSFVAPPR